MATQIGSQPAYVTGRRVRAILSGVVLTLLFAVPAQAHDFWVEPDSHHAAVDKALTLRLLIGHDAERTEYRRNPRHIESFVVRSPQGVTPVLGLPGGPGGIVRPAKPGLHILAYASHPSLTQLPPAQFLTYLVEEGLVDALSPAEREALPPRHVRELYSRCAKALVAVGGSSVGPHAQRMGLELEIVPLVDPFRLKPGGTLPVLLLQAGAPVAKHRVSAYRRAAPAKVFHATTDASGRASLRLDAAGDWLVKSVSLKKAAPKSGADWRSVWATLTFDLPVPKKVTSRD